jgi:hypothetical protein
MNNEIVEFEPNIPQEMALLYLAGKPIETARGPRVMFSVKGGRKLFVDPPVAEQIAALGAKKGEPISICKRESGFEVKRIAGTPVESGEPTAKTASRPPDMVDSHLTVNCAHHTAPIALLMTGQSQLLMRQLVASIEAVHAAEKHGDLIGRPVKFSSEDIRAIAISGFIQQSREGI